MIKLSKIILFLIIHLTFIKSEIQWIYYDNKANYVERVINNAEKSRLFAVDFDTAALIPFYIKVEVNSTDSNPAPLLCFSNNDVRCQTRNQLVKNPNGKTVSIWIKREEFSIDDQELYIMVECLNDGCSYNIRFSGHNVANIEPNFVYSYLVNSYNRQMIFEIQGMEKIGKNTFLSINLEGSPSALLNIEDNVDIKSEIVYKNGKAKLIHIEDEANYNNPTLAIIVVRNAVVGEYLTLSAHLVNVDSNEDLGSSTKNDLILPNGPEISGYLEINLINGECFPIDLSNEKYKKTNKLYITGRVQTKYGLFYLEDEKRNFIEDSEIQIMNGQLSYLMKNNGKLNYICFEILKFQPFNQNKMVFTFSITDPENIDLLYNYYPPQLTGQIYRRIIPKGHIAFFSGGVNDNSAKKYDYNLYQIKGLTEMYIGDCRNYPNCHYSEVQLNNLIKPKSINQMAIWTTNIDKSSAIGSDKYVIVAYCKDDDNENNGYCIFETSIFNKGQDIYLVENEIYSKFVLRGEKGQFVLENIIPNLYVDIMIYNGDVTFETNYENINYQKYYLANKIHYHFIESVDKNIYFNANANSFFTIIYRVDYDNSKPIKEIISSGENYLVQIDPTSAEKEKKIFIPNIRYKNKNPYLVNFYSLNCELEVKSDYNEINFFDGYDQEIRESTNQNYASNYYEYSIKIKEPDLSNYNKKMCMLYVSGYEAEKDNSREIVIGDNINQKIIFEKSFKKIRFLYPHVNTKNDLVLSIKVLDKAYYDLNVLVKDKNIKTVTITKSQIFSLRSSILSSHCEEDTLCPIIIQVEFCKQIISLFPMIEVTIRELRNIPSYLQKNKVKTDILSGDYYYYLYTDIGKNDNCEIIVNFPIETGSIFAKVVRKDQISIDEEAIWRNKYRFPSMDWEDYLPYNKYTQKVIIKEEYTQECIEGCYILITLQISQIGHYVENDKFFLFSILTRIFPSNKAYTDIPKIIIQVDEYVIGSVDKSENERINDFYQIWLPHDSEIVEFDWQSSLAGLYINLGGTRPTTKNADFILLPSGKNSVLTLSKLEILDKALKKKIKIPFSNSIEDIDLVIGIWTDKVDSLYTELYSLRVHQPENNKENIDIIEVNSEQKILCKPTEISDDQYRCLFISVYDNKDVDLTTSLLTYASSVNPSSTNYMFASYIERNIYDEYIIKELKNSIPEYETAKFNTKIDGINYIFLNQLETGKYLFINVISDKPDDIILMTSKKIMNYLQYDLFEINPKSYGEQLFSIQQNNIRFDFPVDDNIMVDIVAISGQGEIYWRDTPGKIFNLNRNGDRISLYSSNIRKNLIIKKKKDNYNNLITLQDAGFVFYIKYHLIDPEINFDEIIYGASTEINHKNNLFPISLYSKIGSNYNDINIGVTFKDCYNNENGEFNSSLLYTTAQLIKERTIYLIKTEPELSPSIEKVIIGNFNPALSTVQIFLSEESLKNYNIKDEYNPSLYIKINKENNIDNNLFKIFDIDAEISGLNDGIIPKENIYHYGKIRDTGLFIRFYKLKTDKNRPFMKIEIAFNSDNLNFAISESENTKVNTTFLEAKKSNGKSTIFLKRKENIEIYYLIIYKNDRTINEKYLNNYSFKYINEKDLNDNQILYPLDFIYETIKIKENDTILISCIFNKIDIDREKANITYFMKVIDKNTYINNESYDTIAMTESPHHISYIRNPEDNEGKITLTAKGNLMNWGYLNIIAKIQKDDSVEYISYGGKKNLKNIIEEN